MKTTIYVVSTLMGKETVTLIDTKPYTAQDDIKSIHTKSFLSNALHHRHANPDVYMVHEIEVTKGEQSKFIRTI